MFVSVSIVKGVEGYGRVLVVFFLDYLVYYLDLFILYIKLIRYVEVLWVREVNLYVECGMSLI